MWTTLSKNIKAGDIKALARCISFVENEVEGYSKFLQNLSIKNTPIIGITGPPGAGKSTLTNELIARFIEKNKKVALLCVDPASPFNLGSLLGDRVRMSSWYNNDKVYIRSLSTRGSLGGLNPKIIEIIDVIKSADFDFIIIETVGVGQSEIEIAGIADTTVLVLVPEGGDDIQMMKAGIMEIANIYVVNKSDRPMASKMIKNLHTMINNNTNTQIISTIATKKIGIDILYNAIINSIDHLKTSDRKYHLLTEKAFMLIQQKKMKGISKESIFQKIKQENITNLYNFISNY